jgi:ATP-dependent DNA ligase
MLLSGALNTPLATITGAQIVGDGVNVAARLESLAEPGGICVSARVQEDVAGRLDLTDPEWLFEFKYDGFRGLCYLEQGRCRFISRNGNVLSRFEVLGDQVTAVLDVDEAIIATAR